MNAISYGIGKVGEPDEHLRYTNVIIGLCLKQLYTCIRDLPWYALYHYVVHFISMVVLLYIVLYQKFSWSRYFFFIIYFGAVELFFLNNLQFTITAFIAGQSGVLLFLGLDNKGSRRLWLLLGVSIVLLVISCMIRRKSFYLVMLLSMPILFITFIEGIRILQKRRAIIKKYLIFFGVTTVLCVTVLAYNRAYYKKDPGWEHFYTINSLKGQFIDYQRVRYTEDTKYIFDEAGWSYNDYIMLMSWFFADITVFSPEKMEKVISGFPPFKPNRPLSYCIAQFMGVISEVYYVLIMVLLFSLYIPRSKRLDIIKIALTALWVFIVMFYLILYMKLPSRVYYPMVSFIAIVSFFLAENSIKFSLKTGDTLKVLILIILLGTLPVKLYEQYKAGKFMAYKNQLLKQALAEFKPRKEHLYVTWGAIFPHQYVLPFDNLNYIADFKLIGISTILHTPFTKARMREFNIDDLYKGIYENDNVFLIANPRRLENYRIYVKEHYGVDVKYKIHYTNHTLGFTIFKMGEV